MQKYEKSIQKPKQDSNSHNYRKRSHYEKVKKKRAEGKPYPLIMIYITFFTFAQLNK